MKRIFVTILAVCVLLCAFAGCNGAGSGSTGTGSATSGGTALTFDIPVPDFLDAQQQELYARAHHLFQGFAVVSGFGEEDNSVPPYVQDGVEYYKTAGEFTTWDEFYYAMLSTFTKQYFEEDLNNYPTYIEVDGALYSTFGARGHDMDWLGPDTFELVSKTDDRIEFNVIGTYREWVEDAKNQLVQEGDIYTERFPIVLEKAEGEWRVSLFHVTF